MPVQHLNRLGITLYISYRAAFRNERLVISVTWQQYADLVVSRLEEMPLQVGSTDAYGISAVGMLRKNRCSVRVSYITRQMSSSPLVWGSRALVLP